MKPHYKMTIGLRVQEQAKKHQDMLYTIDAENELLFCTKLILQSEEENITNINNEVGEITATNHFDSYEAHLAHSNDLPSVEENIIGQSQNH